MIACEGFNVITKEIFYLSITNVCDYELRIKKGSHYCEPLYFMRPLLYRVAAKTHFLRGCIQANTLENSCLNRLTKVSRD